MSRSAVLQAADGSPVTVLDRRQPRSYARGTFSTFGGSGSWEGDGMTCPRCQQENPAEAHFCMKCGAGLTLACAKCNTELPTGAGFCFACGQPVTAAPGGQRFTSPARTFPGTSPRRSSRPRVRGIVA